MYGVVFCTEMRHMLCSRAPYAQYMAKEAWHVHILPAMIPNDSWTTDTHKYLIERTIYTNRKSVHAGPIQ
jgi:hypothetical protein